MLPKTRFTRRRLLAAAPPLLAAPILGKYALDGSADAASGSPQMPASHMHGSMAMGHAAMIGEPAPAVGGAARPRRSPLSAGGTRVRAGASAGIHADGRRPGGRGRPRRFLPGVDVQRLRSGPGDSRHRGGHAARAFRQRRHASAHDPLPRHPSDQHGRRLRGRPGRWRDHLRVRGPPGGIPSLPLPLDPAQEAHCEGPLRRVDHRSEAAAPSCAGARDGDERLRYRRRRREQLLHGQRAHLLLRPLPDPACVGRSLSVSISRT